MTYAPLAVPVRCARHGRDSCWTRAHGQTPGERGYGGPPLATLVNLRQAARRSPSTNCFVPLALAVLAPVVINIMMFDTTLAPSGAVMAFVILGSRCTSRGRTGRGLPTCWPRGLHLSNGAVDS